MKQLVETGGVWTVWQRLALEVVVSYSRWQHRDSTRSPEERVKAAVKKENVVKPGNRK